MSGKGVKVLEENNIQVVIGILEMECQQLIKVLENMLQGIFLMFYEICNDNGRENSNLYKSIKMDKWRKARKQVHQFRHKVTAIMVGVNTVIQDDPLLTCRLENGKILFVSYVIQI